MKVLRPYQQAAIDGAIERLGEHASTTIVLPTGLGKTVVAAKLISSWERGNCLFLAHTRELIDQAANKLEEELGYRPGIEMNIQTVEVQSIWHGGLAVVGSIQTMYGSKRLDKYNAHPFGLIIVDECHHATASTYRKVVGFFQAINPHVKVVGITATPNRTDGAALGLMFESVAYQMSINDSIEQGWLVPITQQSIVVDSLSFDGVKSKKNEFGEGDFNASQLEAVLTQEEYLHKLAVPTIEKVEERPTLIFTAGVRHAHELAAILNRYKPGSAAAVDGSTLKEERKQVVRQFSEGSIQFLCNCQIFTEGFDAPNCAAIVMGRPTKSVSLYTQMLGRGLRPLPGIVDGLADAQERSMAIMGSFKGDCLVLDYVGNSKHKLVSCFDVLGGKYDLETKQLAEREGGGGDPNAAMEQAKAIIALERQQKEREHVKAQQAQYAAYNVDPFDHAGGSVAGMSGRAGRGTATDAQVRLLVNLGCSQEAAQAFSKKQAGAVIDEMGSRRCTGKQMSVLKKHGIPTEGVGMERASRIIDAIAANGWQRPAKIPE